MNKQNLDEAWNEKADAVNNLIHEIENAGVSEKSLYKIRDCLSVYEKSLLSWYKYCSRQHIKE